MKFDAMMTRCALALLSINCIAGSCENAPPTGNARSTLDCDGGLLVEDDGGVSCQRDALTAPTDATDDLPRFERDAAPDLAVIDRDVPTVERDAAVDLAVIDRDAPLDGARDAPLDGARDAPLDGAHVAPLDGPVSDASAPLGMGLGGAAGFGADCLHANDDGSWSGPMGMTGTPRAVDIAPTFPAGITLGGATYRSMYVNTNGNVTFRSAFATYTPMAFPFADQPIIAPWWGDVDTRGGGQPMRNNVCFAVEPARVVVTWHLVGYFNSHDDLQNSFQLVLTRPTGAAGPSDFDVEFRYQRCQWTTGDASGGMGGRGGTPALAGFDLGDRRTALTLPYSRTPQVLLICNTSNVGMPGVWRFRVRGGSVTAA